MAIHAVRARSRSRLGTLAPRHCPTTSGIWWPRSPTPSRGSTTELSGFRVRTTQPPTDSSRPRFGADKRRWRPNSSTELGAWLLPAVARHGAGVDRAGARAWSAVSHRPDRHRCAARARATVRRRTAWTVASRCGTSIGSRRLGSPPAPRASGGSRDSGSEASEPRAARARRRVWDTRTGQPLTEPLAHQDTVTTAAFTTDGARGVTASTDDTARVCDARTGKPSPSLSRIRPGHRGRVQPRRRGDGGRARAGSCWTWPRWSASPARCGSRRQRPTTARRLSPTPTTTPRRGDRAPPPNAIDRTAPDRRHRRPAEPASLTSAPWRESVLITSRYKCQLT